MIGYLQGQLLKKEEERILLLVNGIGFDIQLPVFVQHSIADKQVGDDLTLFIYYQQTERQPKPVLIGFTLEAEKEFFQHFISVEAIGPLKAVKALTLPVKEVARAIESGDRKKLQQMKGIGGRTAQKMIATLQGKMGKFALIRSAETIAVDEDKDFVQPVLDVLVNQLGHKNADARRMIDQALTRNPQIVSPEALFDEVYRGEIER